MHCHCGTNNRAPRWHSRTPANQKWVRKFKRSLSFACDIGCFPLYFLGSSFVLSSPPRFPTSRIVIFQTFSSKLYLKRTLPGSSFMNRCHLMSSKLIFVPLCSTLLDFIPRNYTFWKSHMSSWVRGTTLYGYFLLAVLISVDHGWVSYFP